MPVISAGGGRKSGVQEHLHLYSKLNMERQTGLQETQSQKNVLNLKKKKVKLSQDSLTIYLTYK